MIAKDVKITVTKQFGKAAEGTTEEVLEVRTFQVQPAIVQFEVGRTINLGDFNSARVSVGITYPCYVEEVAACYDFARNWVVDRMTTEVALIKGPKKSNF